MTAKKKEVKKNGMAIVSFVLGLNSFLLWFIIPVVAFIVGILAIIFGFVGLHQIKKEKNVGGKALAIWGIVLGFIFSIILVVSLIGIGAVWFVVRAKLNSSA